MHDVGRVSATPALRAKLPAVWLPLLSHGQLPYPGSIKDRPKYLLSLSRSSAEAQSSISPNTMTWGGRDRPRDYRIMSPRQRVRPCSQVYSFRCSTSMFRSSATADVQGDLREL